MSLFFNGADVADSKKLRDARYEWLQELEAADIRTARPDAEGFLFAYQRADEHYRELCNRHPRLRDRPDEREALIRLDDVLVRLQARGVKIPTPRTWILPVDSFLPDDLEYPLFVRTPKTSWKRGGAQARARNPRQLQDEMDLLRRVFGWDTPIVVRKWLDVASAGKFMFGDAPQEIRTWIVDGRPTAWSFYYLHAVPNPVGFPPDARDLQRITSWAAEIGAAFESRLIVADFVRDRDGKWWFLEAGPGSAAGTAHEGVFKYVAECLRSGTSRFDGDAYGGRL
ncbi:MAG: ATP-grasp domain-containing protein [Pirellulales bacterium]